MISQCIDAFNPLNIHREKRAIWIVAAWTDGNPAASGTNEHGHVWCNGSANTGFTFTAPADTTTRTLTIYAGGNRHQYIAHRALSDGSAADYVVTSGKSGLFTNVYTITYHAASANQKLVIILLKSVNIVGTGGNVDLIAAALATS